MNTSDLLSWVLWPTVVGAGIYATHIGFNSGFDLPLVFLAVNAALVALVVVAEQMLPHRPDWNALTDRQSINDLAHALVENQIGDRLGGVIFLTFAAITATHLTALIGQSIWPMSWPLALQILLAIAIGDGLDYWNHRLLHSVPVLWRFHALHHGIGRLHVFKASRLHFTNVLMRFALVYFPLAAMGAPAGIIFWYTESISILGVIGHSNVRVRVPNFMNHLLMTPQFHRLHHSIDRSLSDTNYANILPFWDRLFGTFSDPARHTLSEVGVVDDPIPSSFLGQFLSPFTWTSLVARLDAPKRTVSQSAAPAAEQPS